MLLMVPCLICFLIVGNENLNTSSVVNMPLSFTDKIVN